MNIKSACLLYGVALGQMLTIQQIVNNESSKFDNVSYICLWFSRVSDRWPQLMAEHQLTEHVSAG